MISPYLVGWGIGAIVTFLGHILTESTADDRVIFGRALIWPIILIAEIVKSIWAALEETVS